jgi:hypothetical protein
LDLIVFDDSKRAGNSVPRPGMGSLVAVGGMYVPSDSVRSLAVTLEQFCEEYGFPDDEEFKWSPGRGSWMRENLSGATRTEFLVDCLEAATAHAVQACVVVEDARHRTAAGRGDDHELDAVRLFIERCQGHLEGTETEAILLADHPSGGRPAEAEFAAACLRTLRKGTRYVHPTRVALVVTEDSKNTRLLQLADLIVGCTLAYVAGETRYSPRLFEGHIHGLLRRSEDGRIGGFGLKLHSDRVYRNLYHWLLGDKSLAPFLPYVNGPLDPSNKKVGPKPRPKARPRSLRSPSRPSARD